MESPSAVQATAQLFGAELGRFRGHLDEAVREASRMFSPKGRVPGPALMSGMVRNEFAALCALLQQAQPEEDEKRLVVESWGQDYIRVHLAGVGPVRLKKRPATARVVGPVLDVGDDNQESLFSLGSEALVLFWDWDPAVGMLRSLSLAMVESLDFKNHGCVILEEVKIEPIAGLGYVPVGAGSSEDDLDDMFFRWDDEADGADEPNTDNSGIDEDEDEDDGDTTVGAAG